MAKKESNTLANLVNKGKANDVEVDTTADVEDVTETAVLPADKITETAIVVADDTEFGEVGGADLTSDDLIIPRLIQVHGVGDLARDFDPGTFCIDGEVQLLEIAEKGRKSSECIFIPLKANKVYRECFDYNDASTKDEIPREFNSEEAVAEAGGRVSTWETGRDIFQPALNVLMAIALPSGDVPEELDSFFVDEYKDERFALLATRWMKSAYKEAGRRLLSDYGRAVKRMGGLPFARYRMWTENTKKGDNYVWVPNIQRVPGSNPKDLVEFFSDLVG